MTDESIELRDEVGESLAEAWIGLGGSQLAELSPEGWRALADAAIAAIEYDHTLLVSAGLLVAIYSDGVVDYRWREEGCEG